ncbi:DNA-directed RNA polymerase sigma-70 factor [Flexivirga endophytica]|uniref:DNA-directed RNA polymerase sigma-70 factor n=1 Tax=Flexivirga endophytica TaxID=1849103 RepID=A0A916TAG3_9MICO|nr:sigma-70 family RNA polymerase sigma factor [Flexivirga endophytica]GGB36231.1 DNA-directed RNA polymerase sigma-70 factor [Flexivirga endophytica]GHB43975.1 DNA-directed RNA polymerase sigma-70 factor [Flexivirga endophytica]
MSETHEFDADLVRRIGSDPDVFEAFYREHVTAVERFVTRRVNDPHLAADLVVDVFLAAIDTANSYRPNRGSPLGWLYGVARHVVARELGRRARERAVVRRVGGRRLLTPESQARLEERIDAERQSRALYAAMAELREDDRALLELVAIDGLSVAEAARTLGLRPGTARVQLHRSRQRLRASLTDPNPVPLPLEASS